MIRLLCDAFVTGGRFAIDKMRIGEVRIGCSIWLRQANNSGLLEHCGAVPGTLSFVLLQSIHGKFYLSYKIIYLLPLSYGLWNVRCIVWHLFQRIH